MPHRDPLNIGNYVLVSRTLLQIAFDLIVNSANFGSDFYEEDDTAAARALARTLNVDPMIATPKSHQCKYEGKHEWSPHHGPQNGPLHGICYRCSLTVGGPVDALNRSPEHELVSLKAAMKEADDEAAEQASRHLKEEQISAFIPTAEQLQSFAELVAE